MQRLTRLHWVLLAFFTLLAIPVTDMMDSLDIVKSATTSRRNPSLRGTSQTLATPLFCPIVEEASYQISIDVKGPDEENH